MISSLSRTLDDLLLTPGAAKIVLVWLDPSTQHLCHTEVHADSVGHCDRLPVGEREIYLIGRFRLDGYGDTPRIADALNALRARQGLDPLHGRMHSLLRPDHDGYWIGAIRVFLPGLYVDPVLAPAGQVVDWHAAAN